MKIALRELVREVPATFKSLVKEAFLESEDEIDAEFKENLRKKFTRFEKTFRALA